MNRPILILLLIFISGAWVIYYFLQPNTPTPTQSVTPNLNLAPDVAKSKIDSGTSQIVNETNLDIKMDLSSIVLKLVIRIQKNSPMRLITMIVRLV